MAGAGPLRVFSCGDSLYVYGTEQRIAIPCGVEVTPSTCEIFVTDAKESVTPGKRYCINPEGTKNWKFETGDIPAHIAFACHELAPLRSSRGRMRLSR